MRTLDQLDLSDKSELLKHLHSFSSKIQTLVNENNESILHLVAQDPALKNSQSISGNCDMTLFEIIEYIIHQGKQLPFKQEKRHGQTPLHYAFKSGNLEAALWIMQIVKKEQGPDAFSELLNSMDNDGMRPIDLLAFRVDDHHKQFIRTFHNEEKNYKLSKQFDAYSWGHSDDFLLGYPQLSNERRFPKKILFTFYASNLSNESSINQQTSIKDIKVANTFTLALSEEGEVYSWGVGTNGHLGHGDENSRIQPERVPVDLKEEEKRIKKLKKKHRNMEEVQELLTLHSFVKSASKNNHNLGQQSFMEQECLIGLGGNNDNIFFFPEERKNNSSGKKNHFGKHGKHNKKFSQMSQFQSEQQSSTRKELDAHLLLLSIEKPQCTNTGAVFSWGDNDYSQLGYVTRKVSQQAASNIVFDATPRKVEQLNKQFIIDVACGDYHSCVLNNFQEVYVWGSNKEGQLGQDMENCVMNSKATKVVLHEYMNSSNKERFISVKAKNNYTVLICETKNIYISDKYCNQFVPVFGRSGINSPNKKLESNVFLGPDYILAFDMGKNIYQFKIFSQIQNSKQQQDVSIKKIALEVFTGSNFIELYPTDKDIWAVNSLRQLLVCKDFKKSNSLSFVPVNDTFNVMKAAVGNKHQVVIKIIKQLDELMMRDITSKLENTSQEQEYPEYGGDIDIPMPSSCMMDMGISISGNYNSFQIQEEIIQEQIEETQFIPTLADLCLQQISQSITLDSALELYEMADHLIIDELKVNCLKFISLNIVSFLESSYIERLLQLPVYLLRDLENFIKIDDSEKFVCFDMRAIEEEVYNKYNQAQQKAKVGMTSNFCATNYNEILEMFEEYSMNSRLQDQLRLDLCIKAHKFRQLLRKAHKKFRKGSSTIQRKESVDYQEDDPEDFETIINYLDLVNEFIRSNIPDEMNDYLFKEQEKIEKPEKVKETQIVILKKKKNQKQKKLQPQNELQKQKENIAAKTSSNSKEPLQQDETIETFFLKAKDEKIVKTQEFEKQSLENDFLIVQQNAKKPTKVFNKSRQHLSNTQQKQEQEKVLLSDLIPLNGNIQGLYGVQQEKEDYRPAADIWNYLDGQENKNDNTELRQRFTSFEEIQKEEMLRRKRTASDGASTNNNQKTIVKKPVKAIKEEDTKNDWGMIKEKDEIDFDEVMKNEKIKLEEQKEQLKRDEEIAKRLAEEEMRIKEEELLQQVLRQSLQEYNQQETNNRDTGVCYQTRKRGGKRGGNYQQKPVASEMKWIPKNKQ